MPSTKPKPKRVTRRQVRAQRMQDNPDYNLVVDLAKVKTSPQKISLNPADAPGTRQEKMAQIYGKYAVTAVKVEYSPSVGYNTSGGSLGVVFQAQEQIAPPSSTAGMVSLVKNSRGTHFPVKNRAVWNVPKSLIRNNPEGYNTDAAVTETPGALTVGYCAPPDSDIPGIMTVTVTYRFWSERLFQATSAADAERYYRKRQVTLTPDTKFSPEGFDLDLTPPAGSEVAYLRAICWMMSDLSFPLWQDERVGFRASSNGVTIEKKPGKAYSSFDAWSAEWWTDLEPAQYQDRLSTMTGSLTILWDPSMSSDLPRVMMVVDPTTTPLPVYQADNSNRRVENRAELTAAPVYPSTIRSYRLERMPVYTAKTGSIDLLDPATQPVVQSQRDDPTKPVTVSVTQSQRDDPERPATVPIYAADPDAPDLPVTVPVFCAEREDPKIPERMPTFNASSSLVEHVQAIYPSRPGPLEIQTRLVPMPSYNTDGVNEAPTRTSIYVADANLQSVPMDVTNKYGDNLNVDVKSLPEPVAVAASGAFPVTNHLGNPLDVFVVDPVPKAAHEPPKPIPPAAEPADDVP